MKALLKDVNIDIGKEINNKDLDEVKNDFISVYKAILRFKDNPISDEYHKLHSYLTDLQNRKEYLARA